MTKELFIESIEKLEAQFRHDQKCSEAFSFILKNDYVSGYDNGILIGQILKVIKDAVNDKDDWIDYYVYELDFGKEYRDGCVTFDGKNARLKTTNDLWNIIAT